MTMDDQGAPGPQFAPAHPPFTPPPPPPFPSRRRRWSNLKKTAAGLAVVIGAGAGAAAITVATSSGPANGSVPASSAVKTAPSTKSSPSVSTTTTPAKGRLGRGGFAGVFPGHFGLSAPTGSGPGGSAGGLGGGGRGSFMGGLGSFMGGLGTGGVVHSSYTVKLPSGSYETIDTQVGTAQDVSANSITVKSADGFTQVYQVGTSTVVDADYDGILSVKVNDNISIEGVVSSSSSSSSSSTSTAAPTVTAQSVTDLTQVQAGHASRAGGLGGRWGGAPTSTTTTTTTGGSAT